MSDAAFAALWLVVAIHGFLASLNRWLHPTDYSNRWRFMSWSDPVRKRLVARPADPARAALFAGIEVAMWGFFVALGLLFLLVRVVF